MSEKHLKNFGALAVPEKIGKAFVYSRVRYFRGPHSGQIFTVRKSLRLADLKKLEAFFREHPPESQVDRKEPFFAFFRGGLDPAARRLLKREGWVERKADGGLRLNIWHQPIPFRLPPGYAATFSSTDCQREVREHALAIDRFFKARGRFAKVMPMFFRQWRGVGFVVNIRAPSGRICASGSVVLRGRHAFLCSGSVDPRHRKKGLWRALVGLRQAVSYQHGARQWALTTETPAILRCADQSVPFGFYMKRG